MPPVGVFHGTLEALVTILIPETNICQDWNVCIKESKERKHKCGCFFCYFKMSEIPVKTVKSCEDVPDCFYQLNKK